jgi:enamine deaminase RidA (YjgF/YER057c/UK114 family)
MNIERWPGSTSGRSRATAMGNLVWAVANATDTSADFPTQVTQSLSSLDSALRLTGSNRSRLLTVQVILQDISFKSAFETMWQEWIGTNLKDWPQRSCFQATLTPDVLIEIVVVAARD